MPLHLQECQCGNVGHISPAFVCKHSCEAARHSYYPSASFGSDLRPFMPQPSGNGASGEAFLGAKRLYESQAE